MKMFNISIVAAAALLASLASCSEKVCKLEGKVLNIGDLKNPAVWVLASRTEIDTIAVENGKFSYSCPVDETKMLSVILTNDGKPVSPRHSVRFVPDAGKISVVLDTLSTVTGSPLTDKIDALFEEARNVGRQNGRDAYLEFCKNAYRENCKTIVGERMLQNIFPSLSVAEMDEFMAMGTENVRNNESYQRMRKDKIASEATAVGSMFIDFSGVTPEGKAVNLSDFVGKGRLTLVDFWASWCGPCMASMPGMVNLWNKWHAKGLDIVGVAVWDKDNSATRVKIREKGMLWPQIFVGEDKSATEAYGISGIPHVILFDAEGKILLRGIPNEERLDAFVAERL